MVTLEIVDETGNTLKEIASDIHAAGNCKYPFRISTYEKLSPQEIVYSKLTINGVSSTKRIVAPNY